MCLQSQKGHKTMLFTCQSHPDLGPNLSLAFCYFLLSRELSLELFVMPQACPLVSVDAQYLLF